MRKSTREVRKPDYFTINRDVRSMPTIPSDEDVDSAEESGDVNDEEIRRDGKLVNTTTSSSSSIAASDIFQDRQPIRKKRQVGGKATAGSQRISSDKESSHGASLFARISALSKPDAEVESWIALHKADRVAAMAKLVNFVLMAAGAQKEWIEEDTDLDALEADEIDQLLGDMIQSFAQNPKAKAYPLVVKGKGHPFRSKFQRFFVVLVEHLRYLQPDPKKKSHNGSDILRRVVEILVSFSSLAVVNIRDSVAEAALSIGSGLLQMGHDLKKLKQTAERQLQAERGRGGSAGSSAKALAHSAQCKELSAQLDTTNALLTTIFNSIYIHRSKDFNEAVRLTCLRHLKEFILFDEHRVIKSEYLKYLGWACYDYCSQVRLDAIEAIKALVEDDTLSSHLVAFVDHFVDRFVEIASGDQDDTVELAMIETLRVMQRQGFLDQVSGDKLDVVDQVVFDSDASLDVRVEALRFLMDHTEGFEEFDPSKVSVDDEIASSGKKNKGKRRHDEENVKDQLLLAKQRNTAQQLETLTEFAEYHLGSHVDWSFLLAEACLSTEKANTLCDWPTIVALLTREGEALTTNALRPVQVSILLRLFAASAKHVHAKYQDLTATNKKVDNNANNRSGKDTSNQIVNRYESLNALLVSSLPALLTRFQDEEQNMVVLSEVFTYLAVSAGQPQDVQNLQPLLDKMVDLFTKIGKEELLVNVCKALQKIVEVEGAANTGAKSKPKSSAKGRGSSAGGSNHAVGVGADMVSALLAAAWDAVEVHSRALSPVGGSSKKKRSNPEDSVYELAGAVEKLKVLWLSFDCRKFGAAKESSVVNELVEILDVVPGLLLGASGSREGTALSSNSSQMQEACVRCCRAALMTLTAILLWKHREVLECGQQIEEGVDEEALAAKIEEVLTLRGKMIDAAVSLMALADQAKSSQALRKMQVEGYHTVSSIMTYFPARLTNSHFVDALAYTPTPAVLGYLRKVFESEGQRVRSELEMLEGDDSSTSNAAAAQLANYLVDELLCPLSHSMIFDVSNANRRQAAAVLAYLISPDETVQSAAKAIAKRLKEGDLVKYLEIQMVALRSIYAERVSANIKLRRKAEQEDDESFDFNACEQREAAGYEDLGALAKKFTNFFGVGKLHDDVLATLTNFFREGINFAYADVINVGFVEALQPYLRFLPQSSKSALLQHLKRGAAMNSAVQREIDLNEAHPSNLEFSKFVQFVAALEGTGLNRKSPSKPSKSATPKVFPKESGPPKGRLSGSRLLDILDDDFVPSSGKARPSSHRVSAAQESGKEAKLSGRKPRMGQDKAGEPVAVIPQRRSSRSHALRTISYNEDVEDVSELEEEGVEAEDTRGSGKLARVAKQPAVRTSGSMPAISNHRPSSASRPSLLQPLSLATGLELEDIDDDEEDDDDQPVSKRSRVSKVGRVGPTPTPSSQKKRSLDMSMVSPIDREESFALSDLDQPSRLGDLDHIPSRRRLVNYGAGRQ